MNNQPLLFVLAGNPRYHISKTPLHSLSAFSILFCNIRKLRALHLLTQKAKLRNCKLTVSNQLIQVHISAKNRLRKIITPI